MNQNEILRLIWDERKNQGITIEDFEKITGITSGNIMQVLNGKIGSVHTSSVIKWLDALGLQLTIEDKNANWGSNMARLRRMPKRLFLGERIESREFVEEEGFSPRVDLFESPEIALKFITQPCDIYQIYPGKLYRLQFDVVDHPYGTIYSYNQHILPEMIANRVTHR